MIHSSDCLDLPQCDSIARKFLSKLRDELTLAQLDKRKRQALICWHQFVAIRSSLRKNQSLFKEAFPNEDLYDSALKEFPQA